MTVLAYDEVWVREPRLMVPRMPPLGRVRLDTSHWLAQRAAAIVVGDTELIAWRRVTFVGATYRIDGPGPAIVTGDSANQYAKVAMARTVTGDVTILEHKRRASVLNTTRLYTTVSLSGVATNRAVVMYTGASNELFHYRIGGGAGGANVWGHNGASTTYSSSSAGFYGSMIGYNDSSSRGYLNGSLIAEDKVTGDGSTPTGMNEVVFGANGDYSLPGAYVLHSCIVVPGLLSYQEYMYWYTNPYEFCIPA